MRKFGKAIAIILLIFGFSAAAETREEALSEIHRELIFLNFEIESLKREYALDQEHRRPLMGDMLERIIALENEFKSLTNKLEKIEFRIEKITRDGANQIGDLSFRLCELTPDCALEDIALTPPPLGTSTPAQSADDANTSTKPTAAPGRAISPDEADFAAANKAFSVDDFDRAIRLFTEFSATYPESPLIDESRLLLAHSQAGRGKWDEAAKTYLDGFSVNPDGPFAADYLLGLGRSMNRRGNYDESCLMLDEVISRYPAASAAKQAQKEYEEQNCF